MPRPCGTEREKEEGRGWREGTQRMGGGSGERERGSNYEYQRLWLPAGRASTVWNYLEKEGNEMISGQAGGWAGMLRGE